LKNWVLNQPEASFFIDHRTIGAALKSAIENTGIKI